MFFIFVLLSVIVLIPISYYLFLIFSIPGKYKLTNRYVSKAKVEIEEGEKVLDKYETTIKEIESKEDDDPMFSGKSKQETLKFLNEELDKAKKGMKYLKKKAKGEAIITRVSGLTYKLELCGDDGPITAETDDFDGQCWKLDKINTKLCLWYNPFVLILGNDKIKKI
jgi:hypothetical protein